MHLVALAATLQMSLWVALLPYGAGGPSNSNGFLRSAVEHRWRDQAQAEQFTYRELWHNTNMNDLGQVTVDESAKFDSVSLNGKTYLRMIERDGIPLQGADAEHEDQLFNRSIAAGHEKTMQDRIDEIVSRSVSLAFNIDLLPDYFHSTVLGITTVNGRDAFELQCVPRTDIKIKDKADRLGTQFDVRVWIDTEDVTFAKVKATLTHDRSDMLSGTFITITWAPVDHVWLLQTVGIHGKSKEGRHKMTFETDYQFSSYRKFHSNSRIVGVPVPVQPPSKGEIPQK